MRAGRGESGVRLVSTAAVVLDWDAGVEGAEVGVEGFHDGEAGRDDAEVDLKPGERSG